MDDSTVVVGMSGDRFADVVDNVRLSESLKLVLHYARCIANNDDGDIEAKNCVTVLESMQRNVNTDIGDAIA